MTRNIAMTETVQLTLRKFLLKQLHYASLDITMRKQVADPPYIQSTTTNNLFDLEPKMPSIGDLSAFVRANLIRIRSGNES